jgi:hypothetical protein
MSILKFGKYKGEKFENTPVWYQNWLLKQDWFKKPTAQKQAKTAAEYGVFYVATERARIFAGVKDELLKKFSSFEEAQIYCDSCNIGGYLDDLHIGFRIRPI